MFFEASKYVMRWLLTGSADSGLPGRENPESDQRLSVKLSLSENSFRNDALLLMVMIVYFIYILLKEKDAPKIK